MEIKILDPLLNFNDVNIPLTIMILPGSGHAPNMGFTFSCDNSRTVLNSLMMVGVIATEFLARRVTLTS